MRDRTRIAILLAPAVLVIGVLFAGGLGVALLRSFGVSPVLGQGAPGLEAYARVLGSREFGLAFLLSLHIAVSSTLIASVLAVASALLIRQTFAGKRVMTFLFQLGLTVPHLVGAVGILYLFSQSGAFARLGYHAGLIARPSEFPALVYDRFAIGIILQYVWKEVPFLGMIVLANMQALGQDHETTARSLGASRWQAFVHVLLPQILPGVLAGGAMVFAFTFGAYEIPALLGQNHPAALPVLAYRSFTSVDLADRPEAMAMALVIALLSGGMAWAALRLSRRAPGGGHGA